MRPLCDTARLWDIRHESYLPHGDFFAQPGRTVNHYLSWGDFVRDRDIETENILVRWDWRLDGASHVEPEPDDPEPPADDYYRAYTLELFWVHAAKGYFFADLVSVCRADEPAVREWLRARWSHLRAQWAPFPEETP